MRRAAANQMLQTALPMAARGTGVDSFNVSVAGGIILYEIMRQRAQ